MLSSSVHHQPLLNLGLSSGGSETRKFIPDFEDPRVWRGRKQRMGGGGSPGCRVPQYSRAGLTAEWALAGALARRRCGGQACADK